MTAGSGTPTGSVDFTVDGNPVGNALLVVGVATLSYSPVTPLAVGNHTVLAQYLGNANYVASSDTTTLGISQRATTTTVTAAPNPATYGQPSYSLTAAIAAAFGTPTGQVLFFVDGVPAPTGTLVAGVATVTYTPAAPLNVGSHTVLAQYQGDASYLPSANTAALVVTKANATVTSVVAAPNPAVYGQATFTLTATVTGPGSTPTGSVNFYVGGYLPANFVGSAPLIGGVATLTHTPAVLLVPGSHQVVGEYAGSANHNFGTGETQLVVVKANTGVSSVFVTPVTVVYGETNATLSATVTNASNSAPLTGGTVTFVVPGVCTVTASVGAGGVATLPCPPLPASAGAGTYTITATYSGNAEFNGSSGTGTLTIIKANTATTIAPPVYNTPCGELPQYLVVTATVTNTSNSGGFGSSTDTLLFTLKNGATVLNTYGGTRGAVSANTVPFTAAIPVNGLLIGTYTVEAAYSGSDKFNGSATVTPTTVNVTTAPTTTTLVNANAVYGDTSVTLQATVAAGLGSGPVNGGTVTFTIKQGANLIGTVTAPVAVGVAEAEYALNGLGAGNYTITAVYSGTPTCYSQSPVSASKILKVAKRLLWVQPKNQSRAANAANAGCLSLNDIQLYTPAPLGTGLANGDTLAGSVTLAQSFNCTYGAASGTPARPTRTGTYNISAGGILSQNYEVRYKLGTLTVTPALP